MFILTVGHWGELEGLFLLDCPVSRLCLQWADNLLTLFRISGFGFLKDHRVKGCLEVQRYFVRNTVWKARKACRGSSEHAELKEISISEKVALEKLMGLEVNKFPKTDDLHPRVLKEMAVEIVDTLVIIFPNSIDSGTVAADWKVVNETPLFKEGERKRGTTDPLA